MNWITYILIGAALAFNFGCTGQRPADIKNSTAGSQPVSDSCNVIELSGQVLTKQNILDIFSCSGWSRQYPALYQALKNAEKGTIDEVLSAFNQATLSSKEKQQLFFNFSAQAESKGQMDVLARTIEKALFQHKFLLQLNRVLGQEVFKESSRSAFLQILSPNNAVNLENIRALKRISQSFDRQKKEIKFLLGNDESGRFKKRIVAILDEVAVKMKKDDWNHLSDTIYSEGSPLKEWAKSGLAGNVSILLDVMKEPRFQQDIIFLKQSIDSGIHCHNSAHSSSFFVDLRTELAHKVDVLKNDDQAAFERSLLDGMTKYVAFQEFCEEKKYARGLDSFSNVLNYVFNVISSEHDYQFIKRLHQIFGPDKFAFLSFLSSQSFSELRDLLINLNGHDALLVDRLYKFTADIPSKDLSTIADWMRDLARNDTQSARWFATWSVMWSTLSYEDKAEFVSFLTLFFESDIDLSSLLEMTENLLMTFPELSHELSIKLAENDYQAKLLNTVSLLSSPAVQSDLSRFLSRKGLFQFLRIVSNVKNVSRSKISLPSSPLPSLHDASEIIYTPLVRTEELQKSQTRVCFEALSKEYEATTSYYSVVNTLPDACLASLGQSGFVGQIYLWMNASQKYFKLRHNVDNFHAATGIWSPGMLQFLFTAAIVADETIESDSKKGIKENIDDIHRLLTHNDFLEAVHLFSRNYKNIDLFLQSQKYSSLESRFLKLLSLPKAEVNNFNINLFRLLEDSESRIKLKPSKVSCLSLSRDLGTEPCIGKQKLKSELINLLTIVQRKNEKGTSLAQELIRWLHPHGQTVHTATLNEVVRFLYDLSSPETRKETIYNFSDHSTQVSATTLDRLEVVIRDISFNNNFYGAYFMNEVAQVKHYRNDVMADQKLLNWLDRGSVILRGVGGIPEDSKWKLKNVRNAYWSLVEVSDSYTQEDGSQRSYDQFIQSLLIAIRNSSPLATQDFNAYRNPRPDLVEGHNGVFLTKIVQLSGLRHLSTYVRNRLPNKHILSTQEFKQVNAHLVGRYPLPSLLQETQRFLDAYMAQDGPLPLLVSDAVDFIYDLRPQEQVLVEEIVFKTALLLSQQNISHENIVQLGRLMETGIKHWSSLRKFMLLLNDQPGFSRVKLLIAINSALDSLIDRPEILEGMLNTIAKADVIKLTEIEKLMTNKLIWNDLITLITHMMKMNLPVGQLNWLPTMKAIIADGGNQWQPVLAAFQDPSGNKLSISLFVEVLGTKDAAGYHLQKIFDEFFLLHRRELEAFLRETFPSLRKVD